jgi:hypothetical protein
MAGCGKGKMAALATSGNSSSSEEDEVFDSCGTYCRSLLQRPRQARDLSSNHLTIWRDAFDLSKLLQTITLELIKHAPFFLRSDDTAYSKEFYKIVGGLCASGIPYQSLMANHGVPIGDLLGTYPLNRTGNQHPMKLITDCAAARDALYMYQRVYGGMQPDNGEFGTSFICGLPLFYQWNKNVD